MDYGKRYLEIKDEIEALEAEKKDCAKEISIGTIVEHNGNTYEWVNYERTSTAWKGLFEQAYAMLDDEAQVIASEARFKGTSKGLYQKFEKRT
jgi:hypothetical protein